MLHIVEGIVLAVLGLVIYQLWRQQGRLLVRQIEFEEASRPFLPLPQTRPSAPIGPTKVVALPPGAPMPAFELTQLSGNTKTLDDYRGERLLLVNWSPLCGFCDLIAPDLAQVDSELRMCKVQLVLAAFGGADANRKLATEHKLSCPILLQDKGRQIAAFEMLGTPSACLIDAHGRVEREFAIGTEAVVALARELAAGRVRRLPGQKPLTESRLEREGLPASTPAPPFSLPHLDNHTISLDDYRGKDLLLVFSDPDCGPCNALAPRLARFARRHRADLSVVLVGRGDPEANRRKAEEHRIDFPVVLQRKWELSRQYGIFATPVAFWIGPDGSTVCNVAKGPEPILALAEAAVGLGREVAHA